MNPDLLMNYLQNNPLVKQVGSSLKWAQAEHDRNKMLNYMKAHPNSLMHIEGNKLMQDNYLPTYVGNRDPQLGIPLFDGPPLASTEVQIPPTLTEKFFQSLRNMGKSTSSKLNSAVDNAALNSPYGIDIKRANQVQDQLDKATRGK